MPEIALETGKFQAFTTPHYAALAATMLVLVLMVFAARSKARRVSRTLEICLGVVLLAQWPLNFWYYAASGTSNVDNQYPCHLCDLTCLLSGLALMKPRQGWFEMLYFWGLAGTMQGMITPALTFDWPHPRYFLFFIMHGGVVVVALYGVLGLGYIPAAAAKWRAWILINGYALAVGGFNAIMGANYGFLCRKPDTASLYDLLGPWPWYIFAASALALGIFLFLDLFFIPVRKRLGVKWY